jgi:hypothetical protein
MNPWHRKLADCQDFVSSIPAKGRSQPATNWGWLRGSFFVAGVHHLLSLDSLYNSMR